MHQRCCHSFCTYISQPDDPFLCLPSISPIEEVYSKNSFQKSLSCLSSSKREEKRKENLLRERERCTNGCRLYSSFLFNPAYHFIYSVFIPEWIEKTRKKQDLVSKMENRDAGQMMPSLNIMFWANGLKWVSHASHSMLSFASCFLSSWLLFLMKCRDLSWLCLPFCESLVMSTESLLFVQWFSEDFVPCYVFLDDWCLVHCTPRQAFPTVVLVFQQSCQQTRRCLYRVFGTTRSSHLKISRTSCVDSVCCQCVITCLSVSSCIFSFSWEEAFNIWYTLTLFSSWLQSSSGIFSSSLVNLQVKELAFPAKRKKKANDGKEKGFLVWWDASSPPETSFSLSSHSKCYSTLVLLEPERLSLGFRVWVRRYGCTSKGSFFSWFLFISQNERHPVLLHLSLVALLCNPFRAWKTWVHDTWVSGVLSFIISCSSSYSCVFWHGSLIVCWHQVLFMSVIYSCT